ncbi:hypothetical protein TeGR_g13867, partial [Tetraparma gracilis]
PPGSVVFRSSTSERVAVLAVPTPAEESDAAGAGDCEIAAAVRAPGFFDMQGGSDLAEITGDYPWQSYYEHDSMDLARAFIRKANAVNSKATTARDAMACCAPVKEHSIVYRGLLSGEVVDNDVFFARYEHFIALNKRVLGGIGSSLGLAPSSPPLTLTEQFFVEASPARPPPPPHPGHEIQSALDILCSMRPWQPDKKKKPTSWRKELRKELRASGKMVVEQAERVLEERAAFARRVEEERKERRRKRKQETRDTRKLLKKLKKAKEMLQGGSESAEESAPPPPALPPPQAKATPAPKRRKEVPQPRDASQLTSSAQATPAPRKRKECTRHAICSSNFLARFTPVVSQLAQRHNVRLSDNELLEDVYECVLEIGSEAAVLVIDLDAVGGAGILDATKLIVRLRSARAYKHLFALIVIEQSTEGLLMQLEAELSTFHNSVGDDRNGDHLTISYCNRANMARFVSGVWDAIGCGENEYLSGFDPIVWSRHELTQHLQSHAGGLSVSGAMQLIDAGRDGAGEPSVDGVRHVVMDAVGQLQAGQRLVGMELAIAQLGHWSSH